MRRGQPNHKQKETIPHEAGATKQKTNTPRTGTINTKPQTKNNHKPQTK